MLLTLGLKTLTRNLFLTSNILECVAGEAGRRAGFFGFANVAQGRNREEDVDDSVLCPNAAVNSI